MMPEPNTKHLEFIQNVITRMNTNSFQIKTWTVSLTSALLAVYGATENSLFILIALFPILVFWFLDAYYLQCERKFRGIYKDVAGLSSEPKKCRPFEMRPDKYTGGNYAYLNVMKSQTIAPMYLSMAVVIVFLFSIL